MMSTLPSLKFMVILGVEVVTLTPHYHRKLETQYKKNRGSVLVL